MTTPLLVTSEGGVTWLRFNRPDRLNAIDQALAEAMRDAVAGLGADPGLRCVVLAGEGRAFMAGGDVTAFQGEGKEGRITAILDPMHEAVEALGALPVPVLASVQGAAAGAGMSIALGADLCIAAEEARFTLAYGRLGTVPDCGGTYALARLLGLQRAMGIALLGESLTAAEAQALGLVNRVVPGAALAAETEKLARQLAAGPREAQGQVKALLRGAAGRDLHGQLAAEREAFLACARTPDFTEGVAAFLGRRAPRFGG
ncbi:enoyl-CoA hydratase-related protein [Siccirubricoccus sp. KC 17139]|uniref:Enoyl-CoA hydratase-related protein n=1 Tax=Siccirubricoccus soli TaxID=2899147 RepID=A0ABT1D140_9PROT|nr:enoyl-CoA hydratase-related protein [Siccirubricoccus soli]MCO6415594.1 enoyl-CoA hydratase-related protein [Siccirubricoccus soli]MCP2681726.1 enoyl-CoA hydratase-related protein [Siccirubricoccus soli]